MQRLDIQQFPLDGVRLIEASAGTGKTYTIAGLYLRLLLERQLSVREILVVTFTNAATEELRDRIRRAIRSAQQGFTLGESDDGLVKPLLERHADHNAARQLLSDALVSMDESAIFTIHGFCQRLLQEHAFESGALFEAEFILNEADYLHAVIEDFWRLYFYPSSPSLIGWVSRVWATPSKLLRQIKAYIPRTDMVFLPQVSEQDCLLAWQAFEQARVAFIDQWQAGAGQVCEILRSSPALKRNIYTPSGVETAIQSLQAVMRSDDGLQQCPEKFEMFTLGKLIAATKKGCDAPTHGVFDAAERLLASYRDRDEKSRLYWLQTAIEFCRRELAERKRQVQVISTDDLLSHSQAALHGASGQALAQQLRKRYPIALIDEFQDTDPLQYDIFRRVYDQEDGCGLWMIGDPKQAIYSFRGADIFAYIQARRDTPERYTLDTNWRSTTAMIKAVNCLFGGADKPFIFDQDIRFHSVVAASDADRHALRIGGQIMVPMQVWHDATTPDKPVKLGEARQRLARDCAHEIARLLTLASAGEALLGDQPLKPRDIAVLVRSHNEAAEIQQALREVGVTSAYLSRSSVFSSPQALAMQRVMAAVAEPGNERLLRIALASEIMLAGVSDLLALQQEGAEWEDMLNEFQQYHLTWRQHGFMAMFQRLLHQRKLTERLLALMDGERCLTNILQLAELLQQEGQRQHSLEGLMHWYNEQLRDPDGDHDDQQLRLESDADLVQVVTIHKSKGLEYPVVFLPFIWVGRGLNTNHPVLFHRETDFSLCLDLSQPPQEEHQVLARREQLAEDLRLLYVALTRAKCLCYLAWGPYEGAAESALGYLLANRTQGSPDWQGLAAQASDAIVLVSPVTNDGQRYRGAALPSEPLRARKFSHVIDNSWRVTSYSALLTSHAAVTAPDYDAQPQPETSGTSSQTSGRFQFPRGAQAGKMLHTLFECHDFTSTDASALRGLIETLLRQYGYAEEWLAVVEQWILEVLNTPLDADGLRLRDISRQQRLDELEFNYPIARIQPQQLNGLLKRLGGYHAEGPSLAFRPQQGIMTGFIDLVFEHQGRYYLLDYKSNHLGDRPEHYQLASLQQAMQAHRYDLQYLIYTVALHRYLRQRLPDYDYPQHFGGVYYLFVRGMHPESGPDAGVYFQQPPLQEIERLDQLLAGEWQGEPV